MTALTLYGTNTDSSTLSTARGLVTVTGASGNGVPTTKIGTSTGYGNIPSDGTTNAWPAAGALPDPAGTGWLFDSTALEGQQLLAGTWTCTVQIAQSVQTSASTADFYVRAFKLANDLTTYTLIGNMTVSAQTITTTLAGITLTGSLPAMSFGVGDKLYLQDAANITANNSGSAGATLKWTNSNSATQGRASNMQIVTPGYSATQTVTMQITDAGLNLLRDGKSGANNSKITYVALGTGNSTPNANNTALDAEVFRKLVTTFTNGSTGEILIDLYLAPTDAVGINIAEVGFFGGSAASLIAGSGVLYARGLYSHNSKTNTESIQFNLDDLLAL